MCVVMTKQIIALVALLSIGAFSAVYAETTTVEVPFASHGQSCNFDEIAVEYMCVWQGFKEVYTIEDLKVYQGLLSEQRYDQEIQKINEAALEAIAIEQAKLTPNELIIQKIEQKLDRGVATAQESVHMNLLKQLDTCKQGMDANTAPFQGIREVTKSSFDKWSYNNIDYSGQVLEIVLAIEECRAQIHIFNAGVGYQNFPTGDDDYQFSLMDIYTPDVQAINFADHTSTHRNINQALICDNNQFADTHKVQFGCEVLYDGKTIEQIELENELRFGTNGAIEYESQVLDDYYGFMDTYGNRHATVEDKKVEALISEPIANAWKENHNFYQNKLKHEE